MKFWLLANLKNPGTYDCHRMVVRAPDETTARQVGQAYALERQSGEAAPWWCPEFWTNPELASCEVLTGDGPSEAIVADIWEDI